MCIFEIKDRVCTVPKAAKCVTEGFSDIATVYSHSGTWNSQSGAQFIVTQLRDLDILRATQWL